MKERIWAESKLKGLGAQFWVFLHDALEYNTNSHLSTSTVHSTVILFPFCHCTYLFSLFCSEILLDITLNDTTLI